MNNYQFCRENPDEAATHIDALERKLEEANRFLSGEKIARQYAIDKGAEIEIENTRLHMQLDASCNAEELRQVRADNTQLREAALAVIMPLIDDTCVHPCDEANMDVKAKACPYGVYDLYRLCLPNQR